MTVIRHNSISGIVSITAAAGSNLAFYDSTGSTLSLDTGDINAGVITATTANFTNATVSGDLTVQGTTTTLDTVVTEVDKLEVNANSTNVAVAITQSGSGDILRLYDGATQAVTVDGNGTVYINGTTQFTANGGLNVEQTASGSESVVLGLSNQGTADGSGTIISFRGKDDAGNQNDYAYIKMVADDTGNGSEDSSLRFWTQGGGTLGERLRITSIGRVGIGTDDPISKLEVNGDIGIQNNQVNTSSAVKLFSPSHNTANRGAKIRFGLNDGSFGGIEVENVEGGNSSLNSQTVHLITHNGGIAGDIKALTARYDGNVGIGSDSPDASLVVDSGITPTTIKITSNTESSIDFNDKGGSPKRYKIGTNISSNDGQFEIKDMTANAERLRITSDGTLESYSPDDTTPNIKWRSNDTNWYGSLNQSVEGGTITSFLSCGGDWSANGTTYSATKALAAYPTSAIAVHNQYNSTWGSEFVFLTKAGGSTTTDGAVTERLRIDTSGRLLVGTTDSTGTQLLKVNGTTGGSINGGSISLTQGRTAPPNGSTHGVINFGSETRPDGGAQIVAFADGTWTDGSDHNSGLYFATTSNGATSTTERLRINSEGDIKVTQPPGRYTIDATGGATTIANSATVDFPAASGMLVVNNWTNGHVTIYLCGGGATTAVASVGSSVGSFTYNSGVAGYRWTNNYGSAAVFGFFFVRTRTTA